MSKFVGTVSVRLLASALAVTALAACANNTTGSSSLPTGSFTTSGIIGGSDATGTEDFAKSVVALYNVKEQTLCTASILSDQILVTAAHCVDGDAKDMRVIFGLDLMTKEKIIAVQAVAATVTSPLWATRQNEETNTGDIALVHYLGGLPPGYQPVDMLDDVKNLKDGDMLLLAGYGLSDGVKQTGAGVLRSANVPIAKVDYTKSEILMDQTKGTGACHGDSGGPAYAKVDGQLALVGVTSRGVNDPQNSCGVSAAYTSIPFYVKWIFSAAHDLLAQPVTADPNQPDQPSNPPAPAPAQTTASAS